MRRTEFHINADTEPPAETVELLGKLAMQIKERFTMTDQNDIDRGIQELIEADKALTQEQRDEAWRANKLLMYADQLRRQLAYLDGTVPSFLVAMNAVNMHDVAHSLWLDDMLRVTADHETERRLRAAGLCARCRHALPLPYKDGQDYCPDCDKDINETIAKYTP